MYNNIKKKIELLAPAKNLECGIAAINHGADAVYIGAEKFSARSAAGNSIDDIAKLASYAHQFNAKVYVAINTILTDNELDEVGKLIHDLYRAGADAIIIQDMGIFQLKLPPIAIHASTQTDNRTIEKVKFLANTGCSRVVLARELSLSQINEIHQSTPVELEVFVHGALCVSYSGQCYISHAMTGRSANRGTCAQYCRLPYDLLDAHGKVLVANKHLLSLKDLDLSASLEKLIDAGAMSLKIEGRLKDIHYVKNITAYYRKALDDIFERRPDLTQASLGKTMLNFEPNPEKSFRRNATSYFLDQRPHNLIQPNTPKSMGEPMGEIINIGHDYFDIETPHSINNGDGLCFLDENGELKGFRVNKTALVQTLHGSLKRCYPLGKQTLKPNIFLYRNQDQAFDTILKGNTAIRKIDIDLLFAETENGFKIELTDAIGNTHCSSFVFEKVLAKQAAQTDQIEKQLSKLGNTIYRAKSIRMQLSNQWFLPASTVAEWRRVAILQFDAQRLANYQRDIPSKPQLHKYPINKITYTGNVTNNAAKTFYLNRGVIDVESGFEKIASKNAALMYTKYCLKYEMGWCHCLNNPKPAPSEKLYLRSGNNTFELHFDCKNCEMQVFAIN